VQPKGPDGLPFDEFTTTRRLFVGLVLAAVLYIVAFWFIAPSQATATWPFWVLAIYALVLHALLIPFGQRMMTRADEEPRLILRYRTRLFIGIGESFTAELLAVVFTFMGVERRSSRSSSAA
jgi:hypothetical protein